MAVQSMPKSSISVSNLHYYFDGVERERLDTAGLNRKSGEWLAMRSKLLQLPDPTFEVVMRSIHSFIDTLTPAAPASSSPDGNKAERERALALFEKVVQAERGGTSSSTASLDKASAI